MGSILGIGIDLVQVERIASLRRRHGRRFLARVFTERELEANGLQRTRDERLATRFAAKEAVMKALGTGWAQGVGFKHIEIDQLPSGQPIARLSGGALKRAQEMGAGRVLLSLTNEGNWAVAVAILEAASDEKS
ncbi:MAG: holo-ACP synthase [Armatimonadetes bacterium]|nr:holo-ACP synthase [Armatimonadota bacterium]